MSWIAFWGAATAVGTVAMSVFTYLVIRQNRQQRRDAARPLLVLMPFDGVDPMDRSNLLTPRLVAGPQVHERSFDIQCTLKNVGVGPALDVRVQLRFMDREDYGVARELAPLGAGETRAHPQHPLSLPLRLSVAFNDADFTFAAGTGWVLVLDYQDVYGNRFHTIHSKDPHAPWTVCGKGAAPSGFVPSPELMAAEQEGAVDSDRAPLAN